MLGKALQGVKREQVVICTKAPFGVSNPDATPEKAVASLDRSLSELGTDYIDVYQLHGVAPRAYAPCPGRNRPGAAARKGEGEIPPSRDHRDRARRPDARDDRGSACQDGVWDVVMVAFHMMHQNARDAVFPLTRAAPASARC